MQEEKFTSKKSLVQELPPKISVMELLQNLKLKYSKMDGGYIKIKNKNKKQQRINQTHIKNNKKRKKKKRKEGEREQKEDKQPISEWSCET